MGLFSSKKEDSAAPPAAPPAPPAPPMAGNIEGTGQETPKEVQKLSTPPVPGGNLDDIKQEVAAKPNLEEPVLEENKVEEEFNIDNTQDSLFDLSELDIPSAQNLESNDNTLEEVSKTKDNNNSNEEKLDFIEKQSHKVQNNETYFITTKQFKTLLEIVEGVKTKVKGASETHLKLLDIKAEEDIEYENLKKDFEFIEDKLHEVDTIIFEN